MCETASKEYYNAMNTTSSFIQLLSIDEKNPMTKKEVFDAYCIYCSNNSICKEKAGDFHNKLKNLFKISIFSQKLHRLNGNKSKSYNRKC